MKLRKALAALLALALLFGMLPELQIHAAAADTQDKSNLPMSDGNTLRLWYDEPVGGSNWTNRCLPIGNGTIGGLTYGEIVNERLHVNEKTLWGGKPITDPHSLDDYTFDSAALEKIRKDMDDKSKDVFGGSGTSDINGQLSAFMGAQGGSSMGEYQDMGDIYYDFSASGLTAAGAANYVRDLDLRTAVSSVNFDCGGVHYEREYFVSHPDHVMVSHFTASEKGKLSFKASLKNASGLTAAKTAKDNILTMSGKLSSNGEQYVLTGAVYTDGGTVAANDDGTITVAGADEATVYVFADTDYKNEYPTYRDGRALETIVSANEAVVKAAGEKGYAKVRSAHIADYQALFGRVELDLGGECPNVSTDVLMDNYRKGDHQHAVEEMAFQMGRYLTIAGSRQGDDLPTNLCGIWLVGGAGSYWGSDFHFNVNVQMNYWPALETNLAECETVFNDYMRSLVVPGRLTAAVSNGVKTDNYMTTPIGEGNGFMVNTQNNAYGHTWPIGSQEYGWNICGSSWALQNVYEYYLYTGDTEYLKNKIYPMLREQAKFWDSYLWYSDYQKRLVVGPSVSAEQGPTVNGTTYDQSLVWELYKMAINASKTLGVDEDLRKVWEEKQSQLNPIILGDQGQVKEWYEETSLGKAKAGDLPETDIWNFGAGGSANAGAVHRHTSQLVGLFPGTLINKDTADWMKAAVKSLEQRTLNGTGWSRAMKLNMYARTGLAEDSYKLLSAMCAGNEHGFLDNLFDSHPPFQIDGNYGYTAGVAEMLLQSQLGYTQFLPCLPTEWADGSAKGLVARGNFVIDMAWSNGTADRFTVTSRNGGTFTGEYQNLGAYTVKDSDGGAVETTKLADDKISFPTTAGKSYTIDFNESPAKLVHQIELAQAVADSMTAENQTGAKALLTDAIAAAQKIVDDSDSARYYDGAVAMAAARERAETAISLAAKLTEATAFRDANADRAAVWAAARTAVDALSASLTAAAAQLNNGGADKAALAGTIGELDARMNAITELVNSIDLTADMTGGTLTLTASDPQFEIRYTLDTNEPSTVSHIYEQPVGLPQKTTAVKAALYIGSTLMSRIFSFPWNGGNLAASASEVSASSASDWSPASNATDGKTDTSWGTDWGAEKPVDLILTYQKPVTFDQSYVLGEGDTYGEYTKAFTVDYWDAAANDGAGDWKTLATEDNFKAKNFEESFSFAEVTTTKVRLHVTDFKYTSYIKEFQISYSKAGGVVDLTDLRALVEQANAIKSGQTYAAADAAAKAAFDRTLAAVGAIAANDKTDADTLSAATDALLDQMAAMNGVSSEKALSLLNEQLKAATALADSMKDASLENTLDILNGVIAKAWEVKSNKTTDQYYRNTLTLKTAIDRAQAAETLVPKNAEAKTFLADMTARSGDWAAAAKLLDALRADISVADALLANPTAAGKTIRQQVKTLDSDMAALTSLFRSVSVEITLAGGKAKMTASDSQFEIRYTLDGNEPSLISKAYAEPVELPQKSLTIKAAAFVGDLQIGEAVSKTVNGANLALGKTAASSWADWREYAETSGDYEPGAAVDGSMNTRWAPKTDAGNPENGADLIVDLGETKKIVGAYVRESGYSRIKTYSIQVSTESASGPWTTVYTHPQGTAIGACSFEAADARYVRYLTLTSSGEPNVGEFEIYGASAETPADFAPLTEALARANAAKETDAYKKSIDKMKSRFDSYLRAATAIAANSGSDADTVAAACKALDAGIADLSKLPVTVSGGSGTGYYAPGETITVKADAAPDGMVFRGWQVDSGDAALSNAGAETAVFTMPNSAVALTAVFRAKSRGGSGSGSVPVVPAESKFPFVDVKTSDWFYSSVRGAWEKGLIDGVSATTYVPDGNLTVAQAIKLAAALHQMSSDGKVTLKNGSPNWYATYVDYAVKNHVIDEAYASCSAAKMNAQIGRAEFVHIFYGALSADSYAVKNKIADDAIPDVKGKDQYSSEIYAFYRAGILIGSDSKGSFRPSSMIQRSEVAAILIRMYDAAARKSLTL